MLQVKIVEQTVNEVEQIRINGPFSSINNQKYKNIGARFDSSTKSWILPKTKPAERLIELMFGLSETLVTVEIDNSEYEQLKNGDLYLNNSGYKLAHRRARDMPVTFFESVLLVDGKIPERGGSMKNPCVDLHPAANCVFSIVVREDFAENNELKIVKRHAPTTDLTALKEEKERLLQRISQIDELLNAKQEEATPS